jgi:tartrate-resistant acid phosphatase type 5
MLRFLFLTGVWLTYSLFLQAQVLIKDQTEVLPAGTKLESHAGTLNFLVMGDWGRNGEDHQTAVAKQMGKTADAAKPNFIVSTGDNFYPKGVISEKDPLFFFSFENIYTAFSLQWDWYLVLGNHDYMGKPDAQVKYAEISRRWKMPARYYSKKFSINNDSNQQVLILFIDTNPLIPQFYSNAEYGPNVKATDSAAQKKWIETELKNASANVKWKVVVGHHPMYTGGSRTEGYDTRAIRNTLKPVFEKYGVDAYISGHEHSLQHLKSTGPTHHFISGSASERTPVKMIDEARMVASEYGFMFFSINANTLWMQTVDENGDVIYKTSIQK